MTKENIVSILKKNYCYLNLNFGVKKLAIFGSFAEGTENKNSDVDLLVEFERPIGFKFIELCEYLEKLLGRKVDILTPDGLRGIRVKSVADNILRSMMYV